MYDLLFRRTVYLDMTRPDWAWLLNGSPVVAISSSTAAIKSKAGSITSYRKHNKPALGPLGDSLDDFK
jgi:hypothetical protein